MASLRLIVLAAALLAGTCAVQGRSTRGLGQNDVIGNAPWLAQVEYSSGSTCAGSVIDSTHILSAAHCFNAQEVANPTANGVKIRVGATDKMSGGDVYDVSKVDMHPNADFGNNEMYDLAVVTLTKPIKFNANVKPIEFIKEQVEGPLTVNGGGWGSNGKDSFEPVLQTFTLNMWPTKWCQQQLTMSPVAPENRGGLMCFKPNSGIACHGDSGSGLWTNKNGKPELMGVLHGGAACSMEQGQALYVNVLNEELRPFLSKFFDMSGVPVTPNSPLGEDINDILDRLNDVPDDVYEETLKMFEAIGVHLD